MWAGLHLFFFLSGWYLLLMSGHTYTSDEETMLATAEGLIAHGSFAVERDFLMDVVAGADGQTYSKYGPGQSLLVIPFVLVGEWVAMLAPDYAQGVVMRLIVLVLPALVTAATAAVLVLWVGASGGSVRVGLLVGLLYGMTTLAMPYSRTFFAEPLTTFFLVVCGYALRMDGWRWWVVAGAAAGCALTVKVPAAIALVALAGYALLCSWHGMRKESAMALGGRIVAGVAGAFLPLSLLLLYQSHVFGSPFSTGYGGHDIGWVFDGMWQHGLYGLILSTGKGLLFFSPTLMFGIAGMILGWRRYWRESLLALGMLSIHLAFYSNVSYWHGDGSWGPRYLVFVVPFFMLPSAGLLEWILGTWNASQPRRWVARGMVAVMGIVAAVSLAIQFLPVLVNMNTYIVLTNPTDRFFRADTSPLIGHGGLWQERLSEWWLHVHVPDGTVVLRDGFSYSEGDRTTGDVLPRWTYTEAQFEIVPFHQDEPVEMRLVIGDHRPWTPEQPLPRAQFQVLLHDEPLESLIRTDMTGQEIEWELRGDLPTDQLADSRLILQSDTWNPNQLTTDNPRNEDLGVMLEHAEFWQGNRSLVLREALPIPPPSSNRRNLWLWYYDTPHHHLFDTWWWYLSVAHLPLPIFIFLLTLIGIPSLRLLVTGGRGVWRCLQDRG